MPDITFPIRENAPPSVVEEAQADKAKFIERLAVVARGDHLEFAKILFLENKELRALLDLFEDYSEFRMGVKVAIKVQDIPTIRDMNRVRKILGYNEIGVKGGAQ